VERCRLDCLSRSGQAGDQLSVGGICAGAGAETRGGLASGDAQNVAGGPQVALQVDFPGSVTQAFGSPPKAALVFAGDLVVGNITRPTKAKPRSCRQ